MFKTMATLKPLEIEDGVPLPNDCQLKTLLELEEECASKTAEDLYKKACSKARNLVPLEFRKFATNPYNAVRVCKEKQEDIPKEKMLEVESLLSASAAKDRSSGAAAFELAMLGQAEQLQINKSNGNALLKAAQQLGYEDATGIFTGKYFYSGRPVEIEEGVPLAEGFKPLVSLTFEVPSATVTAQELYEQACQEAAQILPEALRVEGASPFDVYLTFLNKNKKDVPVEARVAVENLLVASMARDTRTCGSGGIAAYELEKIRQINGLISNQHTNYQAFLYTALQLGNNNANYAAACSMIDQGQLKTALSHLQNAATNAHMPSMYMLDIMGYKIGTPEDGGEANEDFQRVKTLEKEETYFILGVENYEPGKYKEPVKLIEVLSPRVMFLQHINLLAGIYCNENSKEAQRLLKLAANYRHKAAIPFYAVYLIETNQFEEATNYIKSFLSTDQEVTSENCAQVLFENLDSQYEKPVAQLVKYKMLRSGIGIEQNLDKAIGYLKEIIVETKKSHDFNEVRAAAVQLLRFEAKTQFPVFKFLIENRLGLSENPILAPSVPEATTMMKAAVKTFSESKQPSREMFEHLKDITDIFKKFIEPKQAVSSELQYVYGLAEIGITRYEKNILKKKKVAVGKSVGWKYVRKAIENDHTDAIKTLAIATFYGDVKIEGVEKHEALFYLKNWLINTSYEEWLKHKQHMLKLAEKDFDIKPFVASILLAQINREEQVTREDIDSVVKLLEGVDSKIEDSDFIKYIKYSGLITILKTVSDRLAEKETPSGDLDAWAAIFMQYSADQEFRRTLGRHAERSAKLNNSLGKYILGACQIGEMGGIKQNIKRGTENLKESAKFGCKLAQNYLVVFFAQEQPSQAADFYIQYVKNIKEENKFLFTTIALEHAIAKPIVRKSLKKKGLSINSLLETLETLAKSGHQGAMIYLGKTYRMGLPAESCDTEKEVKRDLERAIEMLELGADKGSEQATNDLAAIEYFDINTEESKQRAKDRLKALNTVKCRVQRLYYILKKELSNTSEDKAELIELAKTGDLSAICFLANEMIANDILFPDPSDREVGVEKMVEAINNGAVSDEGKWATEECRILVQGSAQKLMDLDDKKSLEQCSKISKAITNRGATIRFFNKKLSSKMAL